MILPMRLAFIAACLFPAAVVANPTGGSVTSGSATISSSGSTTTVTTSTNGTIINWTSFSIGAGETTRINQPGSASVTLNRVTGPSSSSLNGSLQSNGQVFLTNPNGIVIGSSAQINVAGFVASTLNISDSDFLAGNLHFAAGPAAPLSTSGSIVASDYVALIGPTLSVSGTVSTGPGGIVLAAGAPVSITTSGGVLTSASIGLSAANPVVTVDGVLSSTGPIIIQIGGGSSLPHPIIPPSPPVLITPGNLVITPGTGSGTINWTSFNIGTSAGSIGSGNVGKLTVTNTGQVSIQGTITVTGPGPAVTGVALNLEKREVSF